MATSFTKRFGHIWHHDGQYWTTELGDGYTPIVWRFGERYQCVVRTILESNNNKEVSFGLQMEKTLSKAMKKTLEWADKIKTGTPPTAEEVILKAHKDWPDLYRYRYKVLDQMMFTIGNGYDWFNGRIVNTSPEETTETVVTSRDPIFSEESTEILRKEARSLLEMAEMKDDNNLRELSSSILEMVKTQEESLYDYKTLRDRVPLEEEDPTTKINFYPISKNYSGIWTAPNNVTDDWLAICVESIKLLKNRNSNPENEGQAELLIEHYTALFGGRFIKLYK